MIYRVQREPTMASFWTAAALAEPAGPGARFLSLFHPFTPSCYHDRRRAGVVQ